MFLQSPWAGYYGLRPGVRNSLKRGHTCLEADNIQPSFLGCRFPTPSFTQQLGSSESYELLAYFWQAPQMRISYKSFNVMSQEQQNWQLTHVKWSMSFSTPYFIKFWPMRSCRGYMCICLHLITSRTQRGLAGLLLWMYLTEFDSSRTKTPFNFFGVEARRIY